MNQIHAFFNPVSKMRMILFLLIIITLSSCENRKIKYSGLNDLFVGAHQIVLYENGEFCLELGAGGAEGNYQIKSDTILLYYIDKPENWPNKILMTDNYFLSIENMIHKMPVKIKRLDNKTKASQNDRFELVPEHDKDLREKYEQQNIDTQEKDTALGDILEPIKVNFKKINEIKDWTSVDKRKLNQSTENGVATYYFLQDTLLKIIVSHFGETGKKFKEFYIKNGQLSFVLEQQYQYNRPISWDSVAMTENNDSETFDIDKSEISENCSYFSKGELIRQMNNKDCGLPFAKDYLNKEQIRLETEFIKLKKHLDKL